MGIFEQLYPLFAFFPVLAVTAFCDLRYMKIPNALPLIGLAIFVGAALLYLPKDIVISRAAAGGISFVICFVLFMFRVFGGGDAKILPVLFLFIPTQALSVFLLGFSAAMLAGMMGLFLVRQLVNRDTAGWVSMKRGAGFPMGISIALSGFILPLTIHFFGTVISLG